jgi:hypothetical protein
MRSRIRFSAVPWGFFLEGDDYHGNHGLGSLVELRLRPLLVLHIHISPSTSSGQRNCASWASQPQTLVTLRPQPGGETTKSERDMWWHWGKNIPRMFPILLLPYLIHSIVRLRRSGDRCKTIKILAPISDMMCKLIGWHILFTYG